MKNEVWLSYVIHRPDFDIKFPRQMIPLGVVGRQYGRIGIVNGQSGKVRSNPLPLFLVLGVAIIAMSFFGNFGSELIAGLVAGITILLVPPLCHKYGIFRLRYLDPEEKLKAEGMLECTAIRTTTGLCRFRIGLTPRKGLKLDRCVFAFFDKGKLPWLVGKRSSLNDMKVYKMRCMNHKTGDFDDVRLKIVGDEDCSVAEDLPTVPLAGGTQTYFECEAEINTALEPWEGILSFQIHFLRDGNLARRNVRTRFLVLADNEDRPLRSRLGKVLMARQIPLFPDKGVTQT